MSSNAGHDPIDLVGQESASALSAEELQRQLEIEENDLRRVMGTKEGRRFVWRQLSAAGVYRSSFNTDSSLMAFAEGQRNLGLLLLDQIMRITPERYTDMVNEQREMKSKARKQ